MAEEPVETGTSPLEIAEESVLSTLLRPELEELHAYVPEVPPGIEVKLDANEPPPSLSIEIRETVARAVAKVQLDRYPDPRALRLKEAIAKRTGAKVDELLIGSGSDEVIALLQTALARPRGRNPQAVVLTPVPTVVMYRITARGHGLKPVEVPLDAAWDLDVSMMKRAIEMMQPNLVFIASPNNPTGNVMTRARLEEIIPAAKGSLVIVDEAYIDYAGEAASVRPWRANHMHLGILRTVSKIGLAALRVGWLEASASLVAEVDKVRQPFNVSATSQAAAAAVLEDAWDEVQTDVARVVRSRYALFTEISAMEGFSVTPSGANFLWVKTPKPAAEIHASLIEDRVLVRSFHTAGGRMAHQLRITIGTERENERLLAALKRAASR
jgi:histidinol-phosphate aminotransferase